ncbi:MAG: xanthan lyase [Ignavibacteriae bacterium HGW-Ignavibacteriae-2]|nr:MAG: xanthan lyase [Ignavibacteriae bacterium HGW-Ignavibacteriae-2]
MKKKNFIILFSLLALFACSSIETIKEEQIVSSVPKLLEQFKNKFRASDFNFYIPGRSEITNIKIDSNKKEIIIETNKLFSYRYFREPEVDSIYAEIKNFFSPYFSDYNFIVESITFPIEELVPNYYRKTNPLDASRFPSAKSITKQVVRNISKPYKISQGLNNRNIALWHSHGWYYNHSMDRWLWQRARLFQIVEDLGPMSFVLPYIVPMLENAGANVFIPRERDTQINEVVIDNDTFESIPNSVNYFEIGNWQKGIGVGFLYGIPPYEVNYNPFDHGTHKITKSSLTANSFIEFIPEFPTDGEYSVYVSYIASKDNVDDAHYTVYHTGGKTEFEVNQTIGGNSWYYLGTFNFSRGLDNKSGKVVLDNLSRTSGKIVSGDVVRFGGGMGVVKRGGSTSGRPKYTEGARYYLQYAGMPDTLVYNLNNDSTDYVDDYQSRGEWVNYLVGNPAGPNKDRTRGLGIPIDLSMAFHTDAGISKNDTTIGTLSIYSLTDLDSNFVFPDGVSRITNRDLADILQTQITQDIRSKYDSVWNRRQLYDGRYSEASRPNVPSVLLELLSHQNFLDIKYQSDPRFRFDVSRSIYKAFLKYVAYQNNLEYVVQPLPVTHLVSNFNSQGGVDLSWIPQKDSLEASADASGYIVYKSIENSGFDNGTYVSKPSYSFKDMDTNKIYSFKVTAVNKGGESFPTEIISIGISNDRTKKALVINAFDRISPPASIQTEQFTGFLDFLDQGVPDKYDFSYTGSQHNFSPYSQWVTDDAPGHGASYADYETKKIAGNTFDYANIHGKALLQNGWSFVTASDESVENSMIDLRSFEFVDIIFGEEKETNWPKEYGDSLWGPQFKTFTDGLKRAIISYLDNGGNLFVSGSYIGSDMFLSKQENDADVKFVKEKLKYNLSSDHAVKKGLVHSVNGKFLPEKFEFFFNTELNDSIYAAEAPDAIAPVNKSESLLRYNENYYSAAVGYKYEYGIVAFGFPYETILSERDRILVMKAILGYLKLK